MYTILDKHYLTEYVYMTQYKGIFKKQSKKWNNQTMLEKHESHHWVPKVSQMSKA